MVVAFNKKNTTWTFTDKGAYKTTKSGNSYFPELKIGTKGFDLMVEKLEKLKYERLDKQVKPMLQ